MEQAVRMNTEQTIRHGYWAMFQSGRISAQDVRKKFGISDYEDITEWFEAQDRKDAGYVLVRRDDLYWVVNHYDWQWPDDVHGRLSEALGDHDLTTK